MGLESVFQQIPGGDGWLVPGANIEFNNALANSASLLFQTLLLAPKLATGGQADYSIVPVTRAEQARTLLGDGSIGYLMVKAALDNAQAIDLQVLAVPDAAGAAKAAGSMTFTGAASAQLVFQVRAGDLSTNFTVSSGATQEVIAAAMAAAIVAKTDFTVTAAVNGGAANQVDFAAKHGGETGNDITVELVVLNTLPSSPNISSDGVVQLSGGALNGDLTDAIAAMGDEWYQVVICPFSDATNLALLEAELDDRWSALRQIGAMGFVGISGTFGESTTYAAGRNSKALCSLAANDSVSAPYMLSAPVGAIASESGSRDPARPMQGIKIKGFKGAAKEKRFIATERNLLLRDGLSTHYFDTVGNAYIEWLVTGYTENSNGFADDSYRSVNTLFTLQRIRWEQRKHFSQKFQGYKYSSADDGAKAPAGQLLMTNKLFRGELLDLYDTFIARGWVQDKANYEATLVAEGDPDNLDRINYLDQPTLVRGLRLIAGQSQFR